MAHFAKLDTSGMVLEVNYINETDVNYLPFPESEPVGVAFLIAWSRGYPYWKQSSYRNNFRGHHAGIGDRYDPTLDIFIQPKPEDSPSFILDTATGYWVPPVAYPDDGRHYVWNEPEAQWDCVADGAVGKCIPRDTFDRDAV